MKFPALAVTAFTVAAFIGGTAAAQMAPAATMQPIPNPPENGAPMGKSMHMHHHMHVHHHMHHVRHMRHMRHMMKKSGAMATPDTAAPAPMSSDNSAPPSPQ